MQDPKAIIQILDQAYALTQVLAGQRRYERDEDGHMLALQSKLRCAIMGLEEPAPDPKAELRNQEKHAEEAVRREIATLHASTAGPIIISSRSLEAALETINGKVQILGAIREKLRGGG